MTGEVWRGVEFGAVLVFWLTVWWCVIVVANALTRIADALENAYSGRVDALENAYSGRVNTFGMDRQG